MNSRSALIFAILLLASPTLLCAQTPDPGDYEADRIVRRELPQLQAADSADAMNRLRVHYLQLRETSDWPEVYDCLLGMIEPHNSPQAFSYLRRACSANPAFAAARLAYGESLKWRQPQNSALMLEEAWLTNATDPQAARAWASALLDRGDPEAARAVVAPFLQKSATPEQAAIGAYIEGRAAWQQQDWSRAEAALNDAYRAMPEDNEIRLWWVRFSASRGQVNAAAMAVREQSETPQDYAQLSAALASALNSVAERELAPMEKPLPLASATFREQISKDYDNVREQIPYNLAWDMHRLAQWNDVARGNFAGAWERFQQRIPASLSINSPSDSSVRYQAIAQAIESVEYQSPNALENLAKAMEEAGWTAEATEVLRQASSVEQASPTLGEMQLRLETHQAFLAQLDSSFQNYPQMSLTRPPLPGPLVDTYESPTPRHPSSATDSKDALIGYLRRNNHYLSWMSEPWEKRSYRLMTILMEDAGYPVGSGKALTRVNVVVGEDLLPPAGVAAQRLALRDAEKRDHCQVSISCEDLLHDLFVQQADRESRVRLDAHFKADQSWTRIPLITASDECSPDTLAVIAQRLLQSQNIQPAASTGVMPPPEQMRLLREQIIEALADALARRVAYRLALDQREIDTSGNRDVKAGAYAIANCRWPYLAYYAAYRDALAGDKQSEDVLKRILREARRAELIRDDQPQLLQAYWLTEEQVKAMAQAVFED